MFDTNTSLKIKLLLPDSEHPGRVDGYAVHAVNVDVNAPHSLIEQMLVQVMPDDHSKSVPPLPIPNRTVKRLCADDSAATSVKVGYRQASYMKNPAQ